MNIFELYADASNKDDLNDLLTLGAQLHPLGLGASFLEKDIWVTELLRLLFDEQILGDVAVAFKGGTALSKCWSAIGRFSEDIDLSIHWADLAGADDEEAAWLETTATRSQAKKFRERQSKRLMVWSEDFVNRLNQRLKTYAIDSLNAENIQSSKGEQIIVQFPYTQANESRYSLDHILLEFGGRNRGHPNQHKPVHCYLAEIDELKAITFPTASVNAYDIDYILWEKLTALHQFCTQTNKSVAHRIARHWYDVDCLLNDKKIDPMANHQAMRDVIEMKTARWAVPGVDYQAILEGKLSIIPAQDQFNLISADHDEAIKGGLFFTTPDGFKSIAQRLRLAQKDINSRIIQG